MQRRIAGLAAAVGLLAFPTSALSLVATEVAPQLPPEPPATAFPVHGSYDMGTAVNGFGGGRGHDGQDIFADCGTPVVAARAGKVVEVATEGAEGNYVVLETADGHQQAYLHLLHPRSVSPGERFDAGERIGSVGQTGNAQGCHLHFELWTAPGRFTGGRVFDPRRALDRWDR
jgi:murein DD-endopeptidase MepM/ murein hydrolase activator NlpD